MDAQLDHCIYAYVHEVYIIVTKRQGQKSKTPITDILRNDAHIEGKKIRLYQSLVSKTSGDQLTIQEFEDRVKSVQRCCLMTNDIDDVIRRDLVDFMENERAKAFVDFFDKAFVFAHVPTLLPHKKTPKKIKSRAFLYDAHDFCEELQNYLQSFANSMWDSGGAPLRGDRGPNME